VVCRDRLLDVKRTLADFPDRRNSLNFIRLVLATLVIVSHAWPIGGFGPDPQIGQFSPGFFAVAGFFALSGWLITQSRMSSELPSFLWRRFCRIYPGYFVTLLVVAFVFAPIGAAVSVGSYRLSNGFGYVIDNLTLRIRDWTVGPSLPSGAIPAWNGSLWTLVHEVACYFAIGLMVTVLGRRRMDVWAVAAFIVITAAALTHHVVGLPLPHLVGTFLELAPFFFAGAALFVLRGHIPLHGGYAGLAAVLIAVVIGTGADPTLAALPIAYFCLWVGATLPTAFQRIGRKNDISYGTYIYAFPVQQLIALLGGASWGVAFYTAACVLATLPLAAASWFFVEKPAQHWRGAFDRFPLVRSGYGFKRRPSPATV
jgi:peptidoglycan/LPS O-acetylase OafA/YrhL